MERGAPPRRTPPLFISMNVALWIQPRTAYVGLATQLGLLRLPRMKEILGRKIKGFTASDVHPITVPFLNRKREKQRQEQLKVPPGRPARGTHQLACHAPIRSSDNKRGGIEGQQMFALVFISDSSFLLSQMDSAPIERQKSLLDIYCGKMDLRGGPREEGGGACRARESSQQARESGEGPARHWTEVFCRQFRSDYTY